jgi:hypothetical protein
MTEALRSRLIRFAINRFPDAQAKMAIRALSGDDPDHDAEWWAERLAKLARLEHWRDLDGVSDDRMRSAHGAASIWRAINQRPAPCRARRKIYA